MAFAAPRKLGPFGGLVARDPFRELARFQRAFPPSGEFGRAFVPQIDAIEDDDAFRITAEVPGVDEADLLVEIEDGVLTLKGEKNSTIETGGDVDGADTAADEEAAPASPSRLHRVETRHGSFERRLRFNAPVDEAAVKASYRNGVLTIVVPKVAEEVPSVRSIPVQTG